MIHWNLFLAQAFVIDTGQMTGKIHIPVIIPKNSHCKLWVWLKRSIIAYIALRPLPSGKAVFLG